MTQLQEEFKEFISQIKVTLKRNLHVGEKIQHRHLGPCTYSAACEVMEQREGSVDTLFVEHEGEMKEVTLRLIEREVLGQVYRLQELNTNLEIWLQSVEKMKDEPTEHADAKHAIIWMNIHGIRRSLHNLNRKFKFTEEA